MNPTKLLSAFGAAALLATTASAQGTDDCVNPMAISGFGTFAFDSTNATGSGLNDCNGVAVRKDVFFTWTSTFTGSVRYETCNTTTGFDTRIAVYSGDCNSLNLLTCAADTCMGLSAVTFDAVSGQSYIVRAGGRQIGMGGPGQIRFLQDPCPSSLDDNLEDNDTCDEATVLGDGTVTNLWVEKSDPDWFTMCVPGNGTLQVDVFFTEADGDIDMFAFDACDLGSNLGIGGSATDDEQIIYTNPDPTPRLVSVRVELWISDPSEDCNEYSISISGATGNCSGGGIGTNYCMANTNSTGVIATMDASGSDVAADNNVTLGASNMPTNSFSFFLTSLQTGFVMNPAGSAGNLCLGGAIGRYVGPGQIQQAGAAGTISLTIDLTMVPQPLGFVSVAAGETWSYQAWYRDVVMGVAGSNFTDGITIVYQ